MLAICRNFLAYMKPGEAWSQNWLRKYQKKVLHLFITAMTSSLGYIKIEQEDWGICLESHGGIQKRAQRGTDGFVALLAISCTSPGCHKPSNFSLQNFASSSEQAAACSEAFLMPSSCAAALTRGNASTRDAPWQALLPGRCPSSHEWAVHGL